MMNHPALRDVALFLLRLILGILFIAHGWEKIFITGMNGPGGTINSFAGLGVPQPAVSAWVAAVTEMLGGGLLILGLLTPTVAMILALYMMAVIYVAHLGRGFFAADGGFELPALIAASLLIIVVFGGGRLSLDKALSRFG